MRETLTTNLKFNDVPCRITRPYPQCDPAKTVFYYHGWSSSKDKAGFFATLLAEHGYQVIAPDLPRHGERGQLDYTDQAVRNEFAWRVVVEAVKEFGPLERAATRALGLDPNHLAVAGNSLGGFVASGVFAHHQNLACLVAMNGSCAWEMAEQTFRRIEGRPPAADAELADIRRLDPAGRLNELAPRPILMLHGSADTSVPVECQRHFHALALPQYRGADQNLRFVEIPRLDHYITLGMLEETLRWLDTHLPSPNHASDQAARLLELCDL